MKKNLLFSCISICIFSSVVLQSGAMTPGTQGIFISSVENDTVCAGDGIDIVFNCSGLTPTGTLTVELSDVTGSFASPVSIATVAATTSGTINATVPSNTPQGSGYRVRITSSAPVFTGSPNAVNIRVNPLPVPLVSPAGSIEICQGENIMLDAGEFESYLWDDAETTQTIIIQDGGCRNVMVTNEFGCSAASQSVCITVNQNPVPVITTSGPTAFCEYDSVLLSTGPGYTTYQWFLNQAPANIFSSSFWVYGDDGDCYAVAVADANGCQGISDTVCITEYPLPEPTITADGTPEFCEDDCIILSADPGYACYLWSDGSITQTVEVCQSGSYSLLVCDNNGCQASTPFLDITVYPNPEPVFTNTWFDFCEGATCVTIAATPAGGTFSGAGITGNMFCPSSAGTGTTLITYSYTDANGCFGDTIVSANIYPLPQPTITVNGSTLTCNPPGFVSYQWNYNGAPITNNGVFQTYSPATNCGDYTVTVVDQYGCMASSDTVSCPTSIAEPNANTLGIYPNPASDVLTLSAVVGSKSSVLSIHNALGQLLIQKQSIQNTIDISSLSAGLYFITLDDGKEQRSARFVKVVE